jgi:hypothetical protein
MSLRKSQLQNKNLFTLIFVLSLSFNTLKAQCPTISILSSITLTNCTSLGQTVAAVANYSANITSRWFASGYTTFPSTNTVLLPHLTTPEHTVWSLKIIVVIVL